MNFSKEARRGFDSLVVLGAWILWKTRNDIVFNSASPRIDQALLLALDEADLWMLAGAKGLSGLVATRPAILDKNRRVCNLRKQCVWVVCVCMANLAFISFLNATICSSPTHSKKKLGHKSFSCKTLLPFICTVPRVNKESHNKSNI